MVEKKETQCSFEYEFLPGSVLLDGDRGGDVFRALEEHHDLFGRREVLHVVAEADQSDASGPDEEELRADVVRVVLDGGDEVFHWSFLSR